MDHYQELKLLTELDSVSGFENEVASFVVHEGKLLGYEIIKNPLGSVALVKRTTQKNPKKVILSAHMDEVGFMVSHLNDDGTLNAVNLGGINLAILPATRVRLHLASGIIVHGIIRSLPPHLLGKEGGAQNSIDDFIFDFGYNSIQEAHGAGIKVGLIIAFDYQTILMSEKRLLGKALDDRAGLGALLEVARKVQKVELPYDLYFVGVTQEEVGLRGSKVMSEQLKGDLVIITDVSPTRATMGKLDSGILLRHHDTGMIPFPKLMTYLKKILDGELIPSQDYISLGGTDAGSYSLTDAGIPTLTMCLCAEGIHSPSTILSLVDYEYLIRGLEAILVSLTPTIIEELGNKY